MNSKQTKAFIKALDALVAEKGIDKSIVIEAMEAAMANAYKKNEGVQNAKATVNGETGEIRLFTFKTVVEFEDEDEFETLNGLLTSLIDRILTEDDLASTEAFGYRFEVLEVENKMIKTVKVTKLPKKNDGEEAESCRKDEIAVE